jgi:hypothetical protein
MSLSSKSSATGVVLLVRFAASDCTFLPSLSSFSERMYWLYSNDFLVSYVICSLFMLGLVME